MVAPNPRRALSAVSSHALFSLFKIYNSMTTQTIYVKGKLTPKQIDTITGAVKWIERIVNRKEMLPASFLDNTDPAPLAKELRKMIRENA